MLCCWRMMVEMELIHYTNFCKQWFMSWKVSRIIKRILSFLYRTKGFHFNMSVVSPGGKCWFGLDSKTFEISVKEVKGKVTGRLCERGPNFSSWVRFSGKGLALLVEGAETCSALKVGGCGRSWLTSLEALVCAQTKGERSLKLALCRGWL